MSQITNKLKHAIRRHVQAEIDLAFKGGMHPDDWLKIERNAVQARNKLNEAISAIEVKLGFPDL